MFLTLDDFLSCFPPIQISKKDFINQFTIMYTKPLTLNQIFSLNPIGNHKPIMKGPEDLRYIHQAKIIDYFYEIVIEKRHKYLTCFYNAFFKFEDPRKFKWNDIDIRMKLTNSSKSKSIQIDPKELDRSLSLQKNDKVRIMVRNLFYLEILHLTKVTNTIKSRVSFWETIDNLYNKLQLEDRFFAPSSIGLFLRKKIVHGIQETNYNNLFYLIQQYQPKASILNPYAINWIFKNIFSNSKTIFTPVLSWGSYLIAFMHTDWTHYVGVDVIPSVCEKTKFLAKYYYNLDSQFRDKKVEILCQPSEALLNNHNFLQKFANYFDTILICPPYFNMEIYHDGEQSFKNYPNYSDWLEKYWHATVKVCYQTLKKGKLFGVIANDYYNLKKEFYPLTKDLDTICRKYFKLEQVYFLYNRTSPLRVNFKNRTERLFIYKKN